MPNFRRGAEHIAKANEAASSGGSGDFRPFLPSIYWKEDGQEKYVLILNPIDEIPMALMQKVWTKEGRPEFVVARTDEAIGESKDPLEEEWGYNPQDLNVCVAVELEPEFEVRKGRKRPVGFTVKTRNYNRTVLNSKGEPTDEKEEVTTPVIGMIAQSPNNFFNHVSSQDANKAPVHECAALIRRLGDDKSTDYEVELFDDLELDVSGLTEFITGVSYLRDEMEELVVLIDGAETDLEAAGIVGSVLLDKRLDELADRDYYDAIFEQVDTVARFPKKGWKKGGGSSDKEERVERKSRTSQRRSRREEPADEPQEAAEDPVDPDNDLPGAGEAAQAEDQPVGEPEEEKPRTRRASRGSAKAKAEEPEVSKSSPVRERLEALKAKAEAAKASA